MHLHPSICSKLYLDFLENIHETIIPNHSTKLILFECLNINIVLSVLTKYADFSLFKKSNSYPWDTTNLYGQHAFVKNCFCPVSVPQMRLFKTTNLNTLKHFIIYS